jgi:hypothetical protein
MLSSLVESCADHNDSETPQTARGSQPIYTDWLTDNIEQNLRNSCAKEITPDIRRKLNPPEQSVWISRAALHHRTSTKNYRDHTRNFRKKNTALRRS